MQIISQPSQVIASNQQQKTSEIQNIEFIFQELKNICTDTYQLISPNIKLKSIRKKKMKTNNKQVKKQGKSTKETNDIQNNQTIENLNVDTKEELESKIILIDRLQSKLLYLKTMASKI